MLRRADSELLGDLAKLLADPAAFRDQASDREPGEGETEERSGAPDQGIQALDETEGAVGRKRRREQSDGGARGTEEPSRQNREGDPEGGEDEQGEADLGRRENVFFFSRHARREEAHETVGRVMEEDAGQGERQKKERPEVPRDERPGRARIETLGPKVFEREPPGAPLRFEPLDTGLERGKASRVPLGQPAVPLDEPAPKLELPGELLGAFFLCRREDPLGPADEVERLVGLCLERAFGIRPVDASGQLSDGWRRRLPSVVEPQGLD